jgi:protein-S-isoprenylcysteine O-methyltransferase Ste14
LPKTDGVGLSQVHRWCCSGREKVYLVHEHRMQRNSLMSEPTTSNRSAAIAAAVILLGTGLVFYFMPAMMMSLSEISPWLSYALAIAFVLAFFAVFWLRGRRQRKDEDTPKQG